MGDRERSSPGVVMGLLRATGSLLGVHLEHAQREAVNDLGRVVGGGMILATGAVFGVLALAVAHVAAVYALAAYGLLDPLRALLAVAGADLLLAVVLVLRGRAQLRRPLLEQTRQLLRHTVESLTRGG